MILAIDCGNSRLKWGAHDGATWRTQGVLDYTELASLAAVLAAQPGVRRAVVANVAGSRVGEAVGSALAQLGITVRWAGGQSEQCGVRNLYDTPRQLGADRWAALIGARHLHGDACLVVNAGTATTVDVLDADGTFQGGIILPGLHLMRGALAGNTAQLPLVDGAFADLPRNTADAIASGCLQAQAGAVERMYPRVADRAGAVCLVSGGGADALFDLLDVPRRRVDALVLEGLARIGLQD